MVENLERIIKDPVQSQSDRIFATQSIKLIIEQSLVLGIRTSEDWSQYSHLRDVVDENNALEWILTNLEESTAE